MAFDLLLKGGHLIDPRNGLDEPMDVAIAEGVIARVAPDIPAAGSDTGPGTTRKSRSVDTTIHWA